MLSGGDAPCVAQWLFISLLIQAIRWRVSAHSVAFWLTSATLRSRARVGAPFGGNRACSPNATGDSVRGMHFVNAIAAGILAAIIVARPAAAADTQLWTALFANGPVSENSRLLVWFDGHARYSEDVSRLGVSIIRPAIGYKVNDRLSLWSGYAWVVSRADGRDNITDNRFWQQATYRIAGGDWGTLSGRTRLEQRFLSTGDETGWRARQFVRWIKPLDERWSATAWNETFIALNDTDFGADAGYDQNRTFIGLRWKAAGRVSLEGGYLLNDIRAGDQTNHNVSLSIIAPL